MGRERIQWMGKLAVVAGLVGCTESPVGPRETADLQVRAARSAGGSTTGRIAWSSDVAGTFDIYTMLPDGTQFTRLTSDGADDFLPSWSPNGKLVYFHRRVSGAPYDIYVMNANGTALTNLTRGMGSSRFAHSNGKRIVFTSDQAGNDNIYTMNLDGTGVTQLTFTPYDDYWPRWSPDGKRIVFNANPGSDDDIYVMNADGTGLTNLTQGTTTSDDIWPDWSPDGKQIAFASDRNGPTSIYKMNADGSGVTQLTFETQSAFTPRWSPNGKQIAFGRDVSDTIFDSEVFKMNADGTEVTRLTFQPSEDEVGDWQ